MPSASVRLALLLAALIAAQTAGAAAIGMLDLPARLGLSLGSGMAGRAAGEGAGREGVLRASWALHLQRGVGLAGRLDLGAGIDQVHWPAGDGGLGGDASRYTLSAAYARRLGPPGRGLWLGLGGAGGYASYRNRHTVDADGYLLERLPGRAGLVLGARLGLAADRPLARGWRGGWRLEAQLPVSGPDFPALRLAFTLYPEP